MNFTIVQADIATLQVDAIVNAAKPSLRGGGGVDGAIHHAAGPELLAVCRELGGCKVGEAKVTPGFRLPAKFIVHTVAPRWCGGGNGEPDLLAACYKNCLVAAGNVGVASIAFPCLGTGAYLFPKPLAADIAIKTVADNCPSDMMVVFCCYGDENYRLYQLRLFGQK